MNMHSTPAPAALLAGFSREQISSAIEVLIAVLDSADPDPDDEPNGDELDGNHGEDDFCLYNLPIGYPGCPVSDPEEDEDPSGGNVEDEPQLDHSENGLTPDYGLDQTTRIPDAIVIQADRVKTKPHRDRIRREHCDKLPWFDSIGRTYMLRGSHAG